MFVASVLAFAAGIYVQALYLFPAGPLFLITLCGLCLLPLLRKKNTTFALLMLACFVLCGAMRLALIDTGRVVHEEDREDSIFEATVVENFRRVNVLVLSKPAGLEGMRVAFASDGVLQTGDHLTLFGRMAEINPTFRNPGTSSWKWVRKLEGISYELKGKVLSAAPGDDVISRARRYFKATIECSAAPHTDILKALTIGDRTAISAETNDLFQRTGTSHVLAISGFNVGIISGFFFFLMRLLLRRMGSLRMSGADTRYAALLTIPFPFIFMFIAGAGVSVIRATIMVIVLMLALFLERQRAFYNTMALAALIILLLYPHSLLTPSFQLTFMSLLFIVMFMDRFLPLIRKLAGTFLAWPVSTVLSTAAATLGTAPIVMYYFCGINPFSIVHNLVTVPLIGVAATALALVGMAIPGTGFLLTVAGYITGCNILLLRWLDFGYLYPLVRPGLSDAVLYYAIITAGLFAGRKPVAALLIFVLLPLAAVQGVLDYRQRFNTDLKVHFIDVGMGDAALVEAPGGVRMLIDGGGLSRLDFDIGRRVVGPFLLYRKIRTLDYVVNTHPHIDHIGGLGYILDNFNVRRLVTSGYFPEEPAFLHLLHVARSRGVEHVLWNEGDRLASRHVSIDVLHPPRSSTWDDLNDASLVLRIRHREVTFLLPGDVHGDVEERLVADGHALRSNVLKAAHHGSARSNTPAFLYAVRPDVAVVSSGTGIKALPGAAALRRYADMSIPVLRTDTDGCIEVRSDGERFTVRTHPR